MLIYIVIMLLGLSMFKFHFLGTLEFPQIARHVNKIYFIKST